MSEDDLPEVLFRVRLHRTEKDTPWGFRLQGGVEFSKPLTLLKVIPDSIAAKVGLNAGDILVRLAGQAADSMTHRDAQQAIVHSGNSLEIIVERADVTCSASPCLGPAFSEKGQLGIKDLNSGKDTDEKDDLMTGLRRKTAEEGVDINTESSSEKILNEVPTTTTTTTIENDVNRSKISVTPQIQLEQHPITSTAPTVIPDSQPTTTTTNNVEAPLTDDKAATPLLSSSAEPGTRVGREAGKSRGESSNDAKDIRQADGRLDNDEASVGVAAEGVAVEKGGDGKDEKATDEQLKMATSASAAATVHTDHNDNIPLDHVEPQNSFPVRALLKTSALTSELGEESSEGGDDQSSEFSDDVSVIEVPAEEGNPVREPVPGYEEETSPNTEALFYHDETEYREISLLNFDDRFFEAATRSGEASTDPDTEGEMNRMKACFYFPSLVSSDPREPTTPTVTVQSVSVPIVTSDVSSLGGTTDKTSRDFSQTAPWRVSSKTSSRRADDLNQTMPGNSQQVVWNDVNTHPIVSSYILNDPEHSGPENVIYIPISIFGKQLKLGSQYTFQRKGPPPSSTSSSVAVRPATDSPIPLNLTGRRTDDRNALRIEQPPADQPPFAVVRSSNLGQTTHTLSVAVSTASAAVTMATAKVYIAPIMSQSGVRSNPVPCEASVPAPVQSSSSSEHRRLSNETLSDLHDIPLPPVRDIVADLNSRLEKVAERYETSSAAAYQTSPSAELGTSFGKPERRRSSSGSDSEKEIIIDTPPFSQETTVRLRERLLGDQAPPATTYRSVIYRGDLSPKSNRRFSLPGGALTVKDSVPRRVRFRDPPESSVIEIEGRQRRLPTGERIRSAVGDRVGIRRDEASLSDADYVSVSSLAEKLDRIELENALASAAMKRSRPFQPQVSSLLASHPAHVDIRASSPSRSSGLVGRTTAWTLEPIQERVINIQTLQPPDVRRGAGDDRPIRIGSQKTLAPGAVHSPSEFGGGFLVSIGPGSGGHLSLSVQQHHPNHPNHGSRQGYHPPTKVNFVLPGSELGKPDQFSYSVSAGVAREPIKYTLPPTYEESVRAMASGKHPRSSSLDDPKQISMAAAAAAAVYQPRISELRAESQMAPGNFPTQPGLRIMRAQSPTMSSPSHPGWVISSVSSGQDREARRGYSQTLQVDTGSKQLSRTAQPPPPPPSSSFGLPVYHARSGALSSADLVGYQAASETGPLQKDQLLRIMAQPHPPHRMRQAASAELPRQDVAARFYRSGSPLILSPTGISSPGSAKPVQGTGPSCIPVSAPPGPERLWPSHRFPDHFGQAPSPLTERRWPTSSSPRPLTPTPQQPFAYEQPRQAAPPSMLRPYPEAAGVLGAQRLPGIFALLDKTFTDKVMQWEGGNRSGDLQQSETYKLVREMDDAMKQDKQ